MTRKYFETALSAFYRRRPFQPFTLEFVSGGHVEITHPEALRQQEGFLVYRSPKGVHNFFDCESITRLIDGTDAV